MVFFTCGNCNETVKKNKVDEHCGRKCISAEFVSCVDCGTDFYGDDYRKHTTCITEAEKYGGKDYIAKPSENKGKRKQDMWIDKVMQVISEMNVKDSRLKDILENLENFPNIPQKKPKFINFLKNSFPRYKKFSDLHEQVWNIVEKAKAQDQNFCDNTTNGSQNGSKSEEAIPESQLKENDSKPSKKNKRRKEADEEHLDEDEVQSIREAKKKKRELREHPEENQERLNETLKEEEKSTKDFDWEKIILKLIQKKGEISLKKLRKHVVSEYLACGLYMKSEETIYKKLDRKLHNIENVKIANDRIFLGGDS